MNSWREKQEKSDKSKEEREKEIRVKKAVNYKKITENYKSRKRITAFCVCVCVCVCALLLVCTLCETFVGENKVKLKDEKTKQNKKKKIIIIIRKKSWRKLKKQL